MSMAPGKGLGSRARQKAKLRERRRQDRRTHKKAGTGNGGMHFPGNVSHCVLHLVFPSCKETMKQSAGACSMSVKPPLYRQNSGKILMHILQWGQGKFRFLLTCQACGRISSVYVCLNTAAGGTLHPPAFWRYHGPRSPDQGFRKHARKGKRLFLRSRSPHLCL